MPIKKKTHRDIIDSAHAVMKESSEKKTLMSLFESEDKKKKRIRKTQIREHVGENLSLIGQVESLLLEAGVEVEDDLLTEADHKALESWRRLAGIGDYSEDND